MDFPFWWHLLFLMVLIMITHYLGKKGGNSLFIARKILHIGAIGTVAQAIYVCTPSALPYLKWAVLIAAVVLSVAVWKGFYQIDGRRSWGIAYFPWALLVLLQFFPDSLNVISLCFWILAIADGASALVGRSLGVPKSWVQRNQSIHGKTWVGFWTFFLSAFIILTFYFNEQLGASNNLFTSLLTLAIVALSSAIMELLGENGTDNLLLPFWVFFLIKSIGKLHFMVVFGWYLIPVVALLSWFVWKKKWLSLDGLFAALSLALALLLFNINLSPLLLFFLLGSLSSKWNKEKNSDIKHGKARDKFQVLANGGVILLLPILNVLTGNRLGEDPLNVMVIAVMAAALGDTLSSEFGMKWGKNPWRLTTGKRVEPGLSGGVTWAGLMGALLGGLVMAVYYYAVHEQLVYERSLFLLILVGLSGLIGSLLDSLLGDTIQEKFLHQGRLNDTGHADERVQGIPGVNNDVVNALSLVIWLLVLYAWFSV